MTNHPGRVRAQSARRKFTTSSSSGGTRDAGERGTVRPPLTAFGRRDLIAGKFRNGPEELIVWIMDAPVLDPGAMPDRGVTESEARHIAAYL